jgi:hypothetical protein
VEDGAGQHAGSAGPRHLLFPASQNELEKSSLRNSRTLSVYASQCVALGVADGKSAYGQKYVGDEKLPSRC